MGSKKKNPLRDVMHDLQNSSVLQNDDMSIIIGGVTNHNIDNGGIGDDCPQ